MVYIPYKKTAFVEIPKCASRTMVSAIESSFAVHSIGMHATLQQYKGMFPDMKLGLAIMRDPVERLCSALQFRMIDGDGKSLSDVKEELISSFSDKKKNVFTSILYPQYSFLMSNFPVHLYSMDKISSLFLDLGFDFPPPVENKSKVKISVSEVMNVFSEEFVKSFYAIDFRLYNEVSKCDGPMRLQDARAYILSLR